MSFLIEEESPPEDQRIVVRPAALPLEVVLVDNSFVNELARVEERVTSLKVVDATTNQMAADLLARLTRAGTLLAAEKRRAKVPYMEVLDSIEIAAAGPGKRIDDAKQVLKRAQVEFDAAERRRVAEEEAKHCAALKKAQEEAEAERLRNIEIANKAAEEARKAQAAAKEEADRIAAENAKKGIAPPTDLGFEDEPQAPQEPAPPPQKTEAQLALERLVHAPVPVAAKAQGVAMRVTLVLKEVDISALPDPFIIKSPNYDMLRKAYCVGWKAEDKIPECPGVTFEVKREPVSTRQRI